MAVTSVQFAVATHIMTVLGFNCGTAITSASLAESVNADPTFVRKSLSKLVKAGLVVATRGKNGACALARSPAEITLKDIYLASEAPPSFAIHNYPVENGCMISSNIKGCMSAIQYEVQRSIEQALSNITLAEVIGAVRQRAGQQAECPLLTNGAAVSHSG